jgi:hypothetical protein
MVQLAGIAGASRTLNSPILTGLTPTSRPQLKQTDGYSELRRKKIAIHHILIKPGRTSVARYYTAIRIFHDRTDLFGLFVLLFVTSQVRIFHRFVSSVGML